MRLRHRIASQVRLAALVLLLGIILSPLRAVAATLPTLIAYDVAVRSTATTTLGKRGAVRPEVARGRTACDDATFAYDHSSNRPTAAGVGGLLPYDDALNFGERREVGEGVIYVVPAATAAAEEVGVVARSTADIPATMIGQESGPSIIVPEGATGPTPAWNGKGVQYTGGAGGPGLNARVTGVRIMDATLPKGPSPGYPSGYGSYLNATGQVVDGATGRTLMPTDPGWHIPLQ